jgi:DNA modification methylase
MDNTIKREFVLDTTSWWYKNCKRQRKRKGKICNSCPFRKYIEEMELIHEEAKKY